MYDIVWVILFSGMGNAVSCSP